MTEWVKVTDRYPSARSLVLAVSAGDIYILYYDGVDATGHRWFEDGDWGEKVSHWMPLPDLPDDN